MISQFAPVVSVPVFGIVPGNNLPLNSYHVECISLLYMRICHYDRHVSEDGRFYCISFVLMNKNANGISLC